MAIATRLTTAVTVLYLSNDEARAVRDVLASVSGHPGSRRQYTDDVGRALATAGHEMRVATDMHPELNCIFFEGRNG